MHRLRPTTQYPAYRTQQRILTKHHRLTAARRQHTVRKRVCAAMTLASWHRLCHSRNGKGASCAACLVIAVLEGPGSGTCGLSSARPAVPPCALFAIDVSCVWASRYGWEILCEPRSAAAVAVRILAGRSRHNTI
ncbi:hypothetical protein CFAM422_003977 [Trichoderma lentiforme]|uniref:Uncharacterized protein n=1 Tax=Trichoderma lentiforme TaxID=1567552 RepID=A0A9P5CD89_9HYPO|nr:hypothetical protein CFAM422_003977 [Trichoderma lentiforme]